MEQYIKKSALVAEIERLKEQDYPCDTFEESTGYYNALDEVTTSLDTLEVKEVDLGKAYDDFLESRKKKGYMLFEVAKYFFELGLRARTDKELVEVKIGETQIYLEDDGGEQPYDSKQWLDLSCTEYEIPKALFKDGDNVEIFIRKTQKGE